MTYYWAVVEANRLAQISVLESLGRRVPAELRDSAAWHARVKREAIGAKP